MDEGFFAAFLTNNHGVDALAYGGPKGVQRKHQDLQAQKAWQFDNLRSTNLNNLVHLMRYVM